jgi:hypothetical protein
MKIFWRQLNTWRTIFMIRISIQWGFPWDLKCFFRLLVSLGRNGLLKPKLPCRPPMTSLFASNHWKVPAMKSTTKWWQKDSSTMSSITTISWSSTRRQKTMTSRNAYRSKELPSSINFSQPQLTTMKLLPNSINIGVVVNLWKGLQCRPCYCTR